MSIPIYYNTYIVRMLRAIRHERKERYGETNSFDR